MDHAMLGAVMVGLVNVIAGAVAWGIMWKGQTDLKEELQARHKENCRRFDQLEKAIGISNGEEGGKFVPRRECYLMEKAVQMELLGIKNRLDEIEDTLKSIRNGR